MIIGSLNLVDFSANAGSSYEYYKSPGGEIIGGVQTITIVGSVAFPDNGGQTGYQVMSTLKELVNLGETPTCIYVDIPGHYTGLANIDNVTTNSGSDPAWINAGEFSIEIKAPLKTIPSNSFGITAEDRVVEISRSSKVELSEDSHGYIFSTDFHKAYATAIVELNVRCEPLCSPNFDLLSVINKLANTNLHSSLLEYDNWNKYAKNRSIQVTSANSVTISTQYIITPHKGKALVELNHAFNETYGESSSTKLTISGTITGLTDPDVFIGRTDFAGTCVSSRLSNAESVLSKIVTEYSNLFSWDGIVLQLDSLKIQSGVPEIPTPVQCIKPNASTISKSRTEGVINFSFEWATECSNTDRVSTDINIDVIEPQEQFVEHVIPLFGTLIQKLNTKNARRFNIQVTTTYPENLCVAMPAGCDETNDPDIKALLDKYNINPVNLILTKNNRSISNNTVTLDQSYIEC